MINKILQIFTNINDDNLAFHVTNDKQQVINARKNLCKKYAIYYLLKLCFFYYKIYLKF